MQLGVVIIRNLSWQDHNDQIHDAHIFTRLRKLSHSFLINIDDVLLKFRLGNWMAIQRTLKKVTVELEYYVQHYRGVVHQIKQRIIHERAQIWNFSSSISLDNSCTSERSERVRCQVEHEKRNSISTSNYVLFCLSYKHSSPSLTRNVESING